MSLDHALFPEIGADTGVNAGAGVALDVATPAPTLKRQAGETRRLYASDWADFAAWGRARGLSVLPAQSETVAGYLASLAATLSYGALARRAAAIADRHRRDTLPLPAEEAVRTVLRAARAARHSDLQTTKPGLTRVSARRPPPPGPVLLLRMSARCPGDLAGLRDRALLLLSAAGLAGERLLALDREHVRFTAHGVVLAVAGIDPERGVALETVAAPSGAGQSDQAGGGAAPAETSSAPGDGPFVTARLAAAAACPVRALERWLEHSQTLFGPVFRKVNRWGGIEHARLRPDALRGIWQRRAAAVRETSTPRGSHRRADVAG